MVGTVFNAVTVAIGASAGLVLGKRLSEGLHAIIFQALGLFTLGIGVAMSLEVANLFAVFLSLIAGVVTGHALQLDQRMKAATARLGEGTGTALVQAVLLFCVGAMTLIGCMQDGLNGDATVLFIKGSMDLVSSAFLAAALGRGVLLAAPALLLIQGGLTAAFALWGAAWSDVLIADLTGLGGLLLLAMGLDLLKVRSFALLNFVPAFAFVPLFLPVAQWLETGLPQMLLP